MKYVRVSGSSAYRQKVPKKKWLPRYKWLQLKKKEAETEELKRPGI